MVHYVPTINKCSTNFSLQKSFITHSSKHSFPFFAFCTPVGTLPRLIWGSKHTEHFKKLEAENSTFSLFQKRFIETRFFFFICYKHIVLSVETCPNI